MRSAVGISAVHGGEDVKNSTDIGIIQVTRRN